ncbi:hypothetical protein CBL_09907 [Carabus blaptoides fortunei]
MESCLLIREKKTYSTLVLNHELKLSIEVDMKYEKLGCIESPANLQLHSIEENQNRQKVQWENVKETKERKTIAHRMCKRHMPDRDGTESGLVVLCSGGSICPGLIDPPTSHTPHPLYHSSQMRPMPSSPAKAVLAVGPRYDVWGAIRCPPAKTSPVLLMFGSHYFWPNYRIKMLLTRWLKANKQRKEQDRRRNRNYSNGATLTHVPSTIINGHESSKQRINKTMLSPITNH